MYCLLVFSFDFAFGKVIFITFGLAKVDMMRKNNITQLLVIENDKYAGIIHLHDLVREGII